MNLQCLLNWFRNLNSTRINNGFDAGCNVDVIIKNIFPFYYYIYKMQVNSQLCFKFFPGDLMNRYSTFYSILCAIRPCYHIITHFLDPNSMMLFIEFFLHPPVPIKRSIPLVSLRPINAI